MGAPSTTKAFPSLYAVLPRGTCMGPVFKDGEPVIVSSHIEPEAGDCVIVHLKPEFVRPGEPEAIIKRLRFPLYGATFPWSPEGSDVVIPVALEQLNPPQRYNIPFDRIAALHKVLGPGKRLSDGKVVAPRAMLEYGQ